MSETVVSMADRVMAATYKRFPIVLEKGLGCTLSDSQGRTYTDFVAGIAVCNLGHAHPRIAEAVAGQARKLVHVSNLYYTIPQAELAAWLVEKSFADRVFFANSGAEANEAAIKLARRYFHLRGEAGRYRIISMERSFHGRTMASLSATGQKKIRQGFDPVLEGFDFVPFDDIEALAATIGPHTCAVILEPIQGEGGVRQPEASYLENVRKLCDETGTLLIYDEIQTGMGRTGKLFAYQHSAVAPDIMTLAKALANGMPIGAMLAREEVARAFGPGTHASTFGGTPLVTAAALETARIFDDEDIVNRCADTGDYFKKCLLALKQRHDIVKDVRGRGLLLGMKLAVDGAPLVTACMEKGFLINCIQDRILRFIPPLTITRKHIDALVECLDEVLADNL